MQHHPIATMTTRWKALNFFWNISLVYKKGHPAVAFDYDATFS
jgi:hypothetical protein